MRLLGVSLVRLRERHAAETHERQFGPEVSLVLRCRSDRKVSCTAGAPGAAVQLQCEHPALFLLVPLDLRLRRDEPATPVRVVGDRLPTPEPLQGDPQPVGRLYLAEEFRRFGETAGEKGTSTDDLFNAQHFSARSTYC